MNKFNFNRFNALIFMLLPLKNFKKLFMVLYHFFAIVLPAVFMWLKNKILNKHLIFDVSFW